MIPPNIFSGALLWAPLPLFLLQILIILVVVRVLGKVLHAVNQPMVRAACWTASECRDECSGYMSKRYMAISYMCTTLQ